MKVHLILKKTINDGECQKIGEQCFIIDECSILQVARYKSILRLLSMPWFYYLVINKF
jgi:hypothetical protein